MARVGICAPSATLFCCWLLACVDGSRVGDDSGARVRQSPPEITSDPARSATDANEEAPLTLRVLLAATVAGNAGTASSTGGSPGAGGLGGSSNLGGNGGAGGSTTSNCQSVYCGDGCRDTIKEECDEGNGSPGKFCNWACQLQDNWATHSEGTLPTGVRVTRHLGRGRHPLAANGDRFAVGVVEQITPSEQQVRVAVHDDLGLSIADVAMSTGTWVADRADPVVAVLGNGDVVTAYTEFGGDGDGLGIALRRLRAGQTIADVVSWASSPNYSAQYDADILALSDRILVAYTDEYDATTGPDITLREFGLDLKPTKTTALGASGDVEGRVALAKLGTSWGAAWRRAAADGTEYVEAYDASSGASWSIGPFRAADGDDTPALVAIDATRRMVLYTRATDPANNLRHGELYFAVLDTASPGAPLSNNPVSLTSTAYQNYTLLASRRPALLQVGNEAYMAWSTGQRSADPSFVNGEEVWFERVTPNLAGATLTFAMNGEVALPRWSNERVGDQRAPAVALLGPSANQPGSALIAAWDDYGETLGTGSGEPEVVMQVTPLTMKRDATTPAADCTTTAPCAAKSGRCTAANQCQSGLSCGYVPSLVSNGANFGYLPEVGVCVAPHCLDGQANSGETGLDCGGTDCGTCLCGDGILTPALGEICDTGGNSATCTAWCKLSTCGDAYVNPAAGEECDLGTAGNNGQTCTSACKNVVQAGPLQVLAQRGTVVNSTLPLIIRISNPNATVQSLSGLSLRYWYMNSGAALQFDCSTLGSVGCAAMTASAAAVSPVLAGANTVMTFTINSSATLSANGGAIDFVGLLRKVDSTAFDETDDYSYPSQSIILWDKIALYRATTLVWGTLPTPCGNGIVDTGEACDTKLVASCNSTCTGYIAPTNKTACTVETGCISAKHYRVDSATDNKIEPYVMLTNKTGAPIAMNRIKVKYWLSKDGTTGFTVTPSCTSAKMTPTGASVCGSGVTVTSTALSPVSNSMDTIITMAFAGRSETLAVNQTTGWLVPKVLRSTGTFNETGNETGDWSRSTGTASPGVLATKIGVYVDNILWWGQEP